MSEKDPENLGRMSALGIRESWQVALLLPDRWQDLTRVVTRFADLDDIDEGVPVVVRGSLAANPEASFDRGTPRTRIRLRDAEGSIVETMLFGDVREQISDLASGTEAAFRGEFARGNRGQRWMKKGERVAPEWCGWLRPVYPAPRGVMKADTVRDRVLEHLDEAIPVAARWVHGEVSEAASHIGFPVRSSVEQVERWLRESHRPGTSEEGSRAQRRIEMLAALTTLARAYGAQGGGAQARSLDLSGWGERLHGVPFELTDEQRAAVEAMVCQFASNRPQRHLLSGDVGTGKTVVFALVAAAAFDAGHSVAIMLPNQPLSQQVAREIGEMWPEIPVREVAGGQDVIRNPDEEACIYVGTTALLSRLAEEDRDRLGLVVIDEQQKYSVAQREQLSQDGAHLLEATATCIPRTMALIRYGAMEVSQLKKAHTHKEIVTQVVPARESKRVFRQVSKTVEKGYQVMVIYPLKEGDPDDRMVLRNALEKWRSRFGERVVMVAGDNSDDEKREALNQMRSGAADILIGTTVLEVGIDLPEIRHIVIADASRYGLTQIHQLRGRVARKGGTGLCSLLVPEGAKDKVYERLSVLERTNDGFVVAEQDLRLRGFGDLSHGSGNQSGADESFLFRRPIDVDLADRVAGEIRERLGDGGG